MGINGKIMLTEAVIIILLYLATVAVYWAKTGMESELTTNEERKREIREFLSAYKSFLSFSAKVIIIGILGELIGVFIWR